MLLSQLFPMDDYNHKKTEIFHVTQTKRCHEAFVHSTHQVANE